MDGAGAAKWHLRASPMCARMKIMHIWTAKMCIIIVHGYIWTAKMCAGIAHGYIWMAKMCARIAHGYIWMAPMCARTAHGYIWTAPMCARIAHGYAGTAPMCRPTAGSHRSPALRHPASPFQNRRSRRSASASHDVQPNWRDRTHRSRWKLNRAEKGKANLQHPPAASPSQ